MHCFAVVVHFALCGCAVVLGPPPFPQLQVVLEEMLLKERQLPPLFVVGMEGVFGVFMMLAVVLPVVSVVPGQGGCRWPSQFAPVTATNAACRRFSLLSLVDKPASPLDLSVLDGNGVHEDAVDSAIMVGNSPSKLLIMVLAYFTSISFCALVALSLTHSPSHAQGSCSLPSFSLACSLSLCNPFPWLGLNLFRA
jgi:hypothetical protein